MPWGISGSSVLVPFVPRTSSTQAGELAACLIHRLAWLTEGACGGIGRARSLKWCMLSPRKLECLYGGTLLNLLSTCQRSRMSSISRSHQKSLRRRRACVCMSRHYAWRTRFGHTFMHVMGQHFYEHTACILLACAPGRSGTLRRHAVSCMQDSTGKQDLHASLACAQEQHWHTEAPCSRLRVCRAALARA